MNKQHQLRAAGVQADAGLDCLSRAWSGQRYSRRPQRTPSSRPSSAHVPSPRTLTPPTALQPTRSHKLLICLSEDAELQPHGREARLLFGVFCVSDFEAKRKRSAKSSLQALRPLSVVVHFLTPTHDVLISPPPTRTRMSTQSDSSMSTSTHSYAVSPMDTITSFESVGPGDEPPPAVPQPPPAAEETRDRRGPFSKIVQLFSDKRGNSKQWLRYGEGDAPAPASDIPRSTLPPLSSLPLSPTTSTRRARASLSSIAPPPPPPESPSWRRGVVEAEAAEQAADDAAGACGSVSVTDMNASRERSNIHLVYKAFVSII
ncbi:hypothetical protein K438DRAFT_1964578 [Mycena galopus ATCC 62051]|nr:hypothetical protein K438DRAFT_1964578 [Mycena galopus ATCC 62051]